jgi:hypothetical protein
MRDRRKSLIAGQVCGSNGGTRNRRRTSGRRIRIRIKKRIKKPRAAKIKTLDRQPLRMRRRRLRRSLQCHHSLTRRRPCRALALCGVVVAHVSAIMSSGSLAVTVARHLANQTRPQPRLLRAVWDPTRRSHIPIPILILSPTLTPPLTRNLNLSLTTTTTTITIIITTTIIGNRQDSFLQSRRPRRSPSPIGNLLPLLRLQALHP